MAQDDSINEMDFEGRHIGITPESEKIMLNKIGIESVDKLCQLTMPKQIDYAIDAFRGISEQTFESNIFKISKDNTQTNSFIGQSFYKSYCPSIIRRNILENPSWYTPIYTISIRDIPRTYGSIT